MYLVYSSLAGSQGKETNRRYCLLFEVHNAILSCNREIIMEDIVPIACVNLLNLQLGDIFFQDADRMVASKDVYP